MDGWGQCKLMEFSNLQLSVWTFYCIKISNTKYNNDLGNLKPQWLLNYLLCSVSTGPWSDQSAIFLRCSHRPFTLITIVLRLRTLIPFSLLLYGPPLFDASVLTVCLMASVHLNNCYIVGLMINLLSTYFATKYESLKLWGIFHAHSPLMQGGYRDVMQEPIIRLGHP